MKWGLLTMMKSPYQRAQCTKRGAGLLSLWEVLSSQFQRFGLEVYENMHSRFAIPVLLFSVLLAFVCGQTCPNTTG